MKRQVDVHYKDRDGIERIKTVPFNDSLLSLFDQLKKGNAIVTDIIPNWVKS